MPSDSPTENNFATPVIRNVCAELNTCWKQVHLSNVFKLFTKAPEGRKYREYIATNLIDIIHFMSCIFFIHSAELAISDYKMFTANYRDIKLHHPQVKILFLAADTTKLVSVWEGNYKKRPMTFVIIYSPGQNINPNPKTIHQVRSLRMVFELQGGFLIGLRVKMGD